MRTLLALLVAVLMIGLAVPGVADIGDQYTEQEQVLPEVCPSLDQDGAMIGADARIFDEAQRGCCSWHGGVCGCSAGRTACCDGSLSPSCRC